MYAKGFAVAILSDGKPLRELNESEGRTVRLDFGSEYTIRIKNTTDKRAWASVMIDGTDVISGKLLLRPKETLDLERFCVDGDLGKGKKFKFVQADSSEVQDPTAKENGEIRVTIEPEVSLLDYFSQFGGIAPQPPPYVRPYNPFTFHYGATNGDVGLLSAETNGITSNNVLTAQSMPTDKGATVEGADSHQAFAKATETFFVGDPIVIGLHIRGMKRETQVKPWEVVRENGQTVIRYCGEVVTCREGIRIEEDCVMLSIPHSQIHIRL